MPTIAEIESVWDVPLLLSDTASEQEKAYFTKKVRILTWWVDDFLEKVVGLEYWGPDKRPFHLMTDKVTLENIDYLGQNKVLVSITSEAFAYVVYKNCRDKWIADFGYIKSAGTTKSGKKPTVPKFNKDDPDTHKHQNLWSNSRTGAVAGGGWHEDAMIYLNEMIEKVQKFREVQATDGNELYLMAQNLIKAANEINLTDGQTSDDGKRKAAPKKDDRASKLPKIIVLDE